MKIPTDPKIVDALRVSSRIRGKGKLGGFAYRVDGTVPCIATAIHAGGRVREELISLMAMDTAQRYYEEDPATDTMIEKAVSAVWGLDSRSEYDLNRPPEAAVPVKAEQFWGNVVYNNPPDDEMVQKSLAKHREFYDFMGSWVKVMTNRFDALVVYDIHSYNIGRQVKKGIESPPVFNLGTGSIDRGRWEKVVEQWLRLLENIGIPEVKTTVAENVVFQGKGELCRRLTRWDPAILVLSTEVSKVYMDETTGQLDWTAIGALRDGLGRAMQDHTRWFMEALMRSRNTPVRRS